VRAPTASVRTVVVPFDSPDDLFRALLDLRSAVNRLLPDWRSRPDESRFEATKRSYPELRAAHPHLGSGWWMTMTNETIAVPRAWDRSLRRARLLDPERFERMRAAGPRRRQLKASLHRNLFALHDGRLRITLHADRHVEVDLTHVPNPLFEKYGRASNWDFGLTVRPHALLFHFRVPREVRQVEGTVGMDLNFENAVMAASDGSVGAVDLAPILRIQDGMARKLVSIDRAISKDLRHQRAVKRRYKGRERRRTHAALHAVANRLVATVGERALVVEDLTDLTQETLRRKHRSAESRRRLSRWTHGRLVDLLAYKIETPMVRVDPGGSSQECPRCGGHAALPTEEGTTERSRGSHRMPRRTVCEACGGEWHRDVAAAIVVLTRGRSILRGAPVPPSARDELLEAARWRPEDASLRGLIGEPRKEDDAKSRAGPSGTVFG
jgi:IS605 OrfB family transposase